MTKKWNEIELMLPAVPSHESQVVLNGVSLQDVKGVSLDSSVGEVTEVTITLYAHVNHRPKS